MQITVSEAIGVMKTLRERHGELLVLRNQNSMRETRYYGSDKNTEKFVEPVYDIKALDALVTSIAREIRRLDMALKQSNAKTVLEGYDWDDSVLGNL